MLKLKGGTIVGGNFGVVVELHLGLDSESNLVFITGVNLPKDSGSNLMSLGAFQFFNLGVIVMFNSDEAFKLINFVVRGLAVHGFIIVSSIIRTLLHDGVSSNFYKKIIEINNNYFLINLV